MRENYTNTSAPKPPRCPNCAKPMQLLRRTSRYGVLPDLNSFFCSACDEWHIEEGVQTYDDLLVLARICAANARAAGKKQVARELWKMANEYRERAMALDSDKPIDIGLRPERLHD